MVQSASLRVDATSKTTATVRPHLAPAAIQGLEVLALPVAELHSYLQGIIERNPLLDMGDDEFTVALDDLIAEDADEEGAYVAGARDFGFVPSARSGSWTPLDLGRIRDECSETETLQTHLRSQLGGVEQKGVARSLVEALIECLNDDGYFDGSLPVLCSEMGASAEEGEHALRYLQSLNPRGVGARNLRECLLLQIVGDDPRSALMRAVIDESLEDLAENRTTKLMRAHHISLDELARVREAIAHLNPRPGADFSQRKDTVYVVPDIVIERRGTSFSVRVVGEIAERIVRHSEYESLVAKSGDGEALEWLAEKRAEADAALANVSQRKRTLFRFGTYLVEAQYDFFCRGEVAMRPLTMQQVADGLGLHVSTVSRIVQDKYVLTPWGTYPLKHFFTSALPCSTGRNTHAMSSAAIKERIKALVAAENSRSPLSDAALTEALNSEGIEIKRRTVAKYREAVGIPRQSCRRR